ncbi:MAG TPA: Gfo/Idh/MocA family oxidoreductase [Opitutaceae bacterium]|nr:Gfo/Idh/MocA family oxidoreductase [Opitutaceae bacterium]
MSPLTRRTFLKNTAVVTAGAALSARSWSQVAGANGDIRIGVAGINSRGKNLLTEASKIAGVRIVALCDVDSAVLDSVAKGYPDAKKFIDFREMLAMPGLDVVAIATPNHQHALQAIWAMQAGKDVFLEKPVAHDIWEGRQIVAAQAKYSRLVQAGTQSRSSIAIAEAIDWVRAGNLGRITAARGLCYKRRASIGKTTGPQPVPSTVNYDLWCGPAPLEPLHRTRFHYDWHWQWATGNGDIANQGNHQMDVALRFLGETELAPHVFTVGGRFGYVDDGQTPNTLISMLAYTKAPLVFEVRGLPAKPDAYSNVAVGPGGSTGSEAMVAAMDRYHGLTVGNVIHCEGGEVIVPATDYSLVQVNDRDGKLIKEFKGIGLHMSNFIDAVRSRKASDLHAPVRQGCVSGGLCHCSNISYLTGRGLHAGEIRERLQGNAQMLEMFGRLNDHLGANGIDLTQSTATFGLPLTVDPKTERFTGSDAGPANALLRREYRAGYVVPEIA